MTGSTSKRIPIAAARSVAEKHDLRQVLLIGFDGESVHVVTYGKTKADCAAAAKAQDFWTGKIREFSFRGTALAAPARAAPAVPMERVCDECVKLRRALDAKDKAMGELFERLDKAGVDYSDLMS